MISLLLSNSFHFQKLREKYKIDDSDLSRETITKLTDNKYIDGRKIFNYHCKAKSNVQYEWITVFHLIKQFFKLLFFFLF